MPGLGRWSIPLQGEDIMSTRACYRFIDPDSTDPEVVTVYKHSDGYPEGAVCWITKALELRQLIAALESRWAGVTDGRIVKLMSWAREYVGKLDADISVKRIGYLIDDEELLPTDDAV